MEQSASVVESVGVGIGKAGPNATSERAEREIAVTQSGPSGVRCNGKKRVEEFVKVQKELLEKLQEPNRQWF